MPSFDRASLTSSSLKGLMIASIFFIRASSGRTFTSCAKAVPVPDRENPQENFAFLGGGSAPCSEEWQGKLLLLKLCTRAAQGAADSSAAALTGNAQTT